MDDLKTYTCDFCGEQFSNAVDYLRHLEMEHDAVGNHWRTMDEESADRHIKMLGL